MTVIKDAAGRYFASFVVEVEPSQLPQSDSEVGVDLGLERFAVLSNGKIIDNPRLLRRAERKLIKAQRAYSRKRRHSNNQGKARIKLAKAHVKVADARRDFVHKQSTAIIRENQAVYVEDLNIKGMARTRLAKSLHDAGWGMFVRMLQEKAMRYGRHFGRVDRFFPSSQRCSVCGAVDGKKPLNIRSWSCDCGAVHDRDANAAENILAAGQAERKNACGAQVRPAAMLAPRDEAGTRLEGRNTLEGSSSPGLERMSRPVLSDDKMIMRYRPLRGTER